MKTTVMSPVKRFTLVAFGLAIAAMGLYVANADDAPGAAVIGMLLMVVGVVLGVRAARNRLPKWTGRTALTAGAVARICGGRRAGTGVRARSRTRAKHARGVRGGRYRRHHRLGRRVRMEG